MDQIKQIQINNTNIVITAGPYIAYGIGGKTTVDIDEKTVPTLTGFVTRMLHGWIQILKYLY